MEQSIVLEELRVIAKQLSEDMLEEVLNLIRYFKLLDQGIFEPSLLSQSAREWMIQK